MSQFEKKQGEEEHQMKFFKGKKWKEKRLNARFIKKNDRKASPSALSPCTSLSRWASSAPWRSRTRRCRRREFRWLQRSRWCPRSTAPCGEYCSTASPVFNTWAYTEVGNAFRPQGGGTTESTNFRENKDHKTYQMHYL